MISAFISLLFLLGSLFIVVYSLLSLIDTTLLLLVCNQEQRRDIMSELGILAYAFGLPYFCYINRRRQG
jgi:hypothetical protein